MPEVLDVSNLTDRSLIATSVGGAVNLRTGRSTAYIAEFGLVWWAMKSATCQSSLRRMLLKP